MIEELPTHQAGDSLGAYELVGELARGGMGVVYRAFHAELERDVALKVLDPRVVTQELIRRLRREAAVAARLSHPGIIAIQEFGSAPHPGSGEPVHFIVMDLIEGGTLSERIDDMSLEQRIDVLRQVSEAVGFAHGQGVVHRDIKPANILFTLGGRPIVSDFGLACGQQDTRLTQTGTVLGTASYMAPEQVMATQRLLDARTDVWALGVLLYRMLCGKLPFEAPTLQEIFQAIINAEPPAFDRQGHQVPAPLDSICRKALEKNPAHRFADGEALAVALACWERGEPVPIHSRKTVDHWRRRLRQRRRQIVTALLLAATLCVAWLLTGQLRWRTRKLDEQRKQTEQGKAEIDDQRARQRQLTDQVRVSQRMQIFKSVGKKIHETRPFFYIAQVDMRRKLDEVERALAELEPLTRDPEVAKQPQLWAELGSGWYFAGWSERAEQALLRAEQAGSQDWRAGYYLGRIYLERIESSRLGGLPRIDLARKAQRYLQLTSTGSGSGKLERHLASAYLAHARDDVEQVLQHCRDGRRRFGQQMGSEEYWHLQGMVLSDPQEKIQAFREAIRRCPHHARAHHELGLTLFLQLGKKRDALLSFDRAVQINPRYTKAYANRSAVRTHSGDYVGAISDLDRALELLHQRPAYRAILYRNRGMAYYHQGDLHAALDDYSKAIHHAPQRARAYVDRALIRHEAADVDGMLRDLNRAIAIDPQFRQVSDRKLWLRASGNETPLGHRAYLERGRLRMLRQDYRGALRDLDLALRFKQDSAVAHDIRGQARMGLGDPARAIADYTQALKLDPKSAATYNNRGLARQNQGDLTGAIADFTLALKHDPKLAELYYNRSVAHLAKSDHTAAIADLNQAITLDPKLALAYHNRGIALRAKGDLAGAIADYTQLIKLDPTSHDAHTNRGEARLVMGDISGALADFTRAITLAPKFWRTWANKGLVLCQVNRRKEGIRALQQALELAPAEVKPRLAAQIEQLQSDR